MAENKFIEYEEEKTPKTNKLGENKFFKTVSSILNGSALNRENVVKQLPFLFFIVFLLMVYIGYGYKARKTIIQTSVLKNQIEELKSEYISITSTLEQKKRPSKIATAIKKTGLKESTVPPKKIIE